MKPLCVVRPFPQAQQGRLLVAVLVSFAVVAGLVAVLAWGAWRWYTTAPVLEQGRAALVVNVTKGAGARAAMRSLNQQGVLANPMALQLALRLRGDAHKVRPGTYELKAELTVQTLLNKLVRGEVMLSELRLIEGWTWQQARQAINKHPDLAHDTAQLSDQDLARALGIQEKHPEGWLFPSTYSFSPGSSDLDIYRQAYEQMQKHLAQAWANKAANVPLKTPYDLLTLASIVEKETGLAADRGNVASVFVNRLRINMMLQSDPTTIYGMGERFKGNLRRIDLQTDSAYNTYTRAGLTPTPIALPGLASLNAVANPASSNYLYFVAKGNGASEFSETLPQHNAAVNRYQRGGNK
jgi:UPF0755 protein